jgi:hypothetical protein
MSEKIKIRFEIKMLSPGSRSYNRADFFPSQDLFIEVEIPLEQKYVVNAALIEEAEATTKLGFPTPTPNPILTIDGFTYLENILLNRGSEKKTDPETEFGYSDLDFSD